VGIREIVASESANIVTAQHQTARFFLISMLFQIVATIKALGFQEEREWRMFSMSHETHPVRAGRVGLVPHVEIGVWRGARDEETKALPNPPTIVDLVVGPGPDQSRQVLAAKELLAGVGHDPEVVRPSGVTYR
jgi:hypothetical protein